jgi:glycosyltransferase involved in cell wall biosynthesis
MKVALISTPFLATPPHTYGGTELVVAELADGLVANGHEVTLFATGDSRTHATLRSLYDRPQWPPSSVTELNHVSWALGRVRRAAARGRPYDLVHTHAATALACARLLARRPPVVYTVHHARDDALSSFYRHFPSTHFVAISADQARREVALPTLSVVHHGLSPEDYQCRPTADRYACFIGRLAPVKAPHIAIDVARAAGLPIRVAGNVHEADTVYGAQEVAPRLAWPHVAYLGSIGLDEKVPLLRDARALLAPLQWDEPFGLVMIEAMLSGCPVIAFPRGSAPELIEPGVTGYLVRDAAAMTELLRPGSVLDRFDRMRCRAWAADRFGRARMVAAYETVYTHAVRRARAASRSARDTAPRSHRPPRATRAIRGA